MFLPAASPPGPPFSSHPSLTFLYPWGLSAEPGNHKFIFCAAQRAAAPRMPALHLAQLLQAVAEAPEIPPARPRPWVGTGGSSGGKRKSWCRLGALWGKQQLLLHLLASLQSEPAPLLDRCPAPNPAAGRDLGYTKQGPALRPLAGSTKLCSS